MARVFIDSFETQNLNLWEDVYNGSIVSTAGLGLKGNYCVYLLTDNNYIEKNVLAKNEYYFSFLWYLDSVSNCYVIKLFNGGSELVRGQFHNSKLEWITNGSGWYRLYESNISYVLNTVCFMQIYIKISNTSSGKIYVKANGVLDRDSTGAMLTSSAANRIRFYGKAHYDNIVIDDSIMPEETEICILKPNGVGAFSEWNTSVSGNNYTFVDEVPYNDSDFVSSGIVNAIDTYALEDMPINTKDVKCVQAQARARKDSDSTVTSFNFVMREGTKNYDSSTLSLSNIFSTYTSMYNDGPTGSGFWYKPNMNSMEIGVKTRT